MLSKEKLTEEANRIANVYCANIGYDFKYKEKVDGTFISGYKSREDFIYILKWLLPFYIGYQSAIVYLITVNKY